MHLNQRFVGFERRAAGRKTQNERAVGGGVEIVNALNNMAGGPFANLLRRR